MEKITVANERLRIAFGNYDRERETQTEGLKNRERKLIERLSSLDKMKLGMIHAHGNAEATGEDVLEVNAGGKIIAAKRATLTQVKSSRLEALFSGRWDKKLLRDNCGRVFLDVNPVLFEAIVDYLNDMAIMPRNEAHLPSVDEDHEKILWHYMELFGLNPARMPGSKVIRNDHGSVLHDWLKEDGADGEFNILYRISRDGLDDETFHTKCDGQGPTLVVIETTEGHVIGGYSNTSWAKGHGYCAANKAFLFALCESGLLSLAKMKLKNSNGTHGLYFQPGFGPIFGKGHNLKVKAQHVSSRRDTWGSYEDSSSWPLRHGEYKIKEMEIIQVREKPFQASNPKTETNFSKEINDAINAKHTALQEAEAGILAAEDSFKDEEAFISFFANGQPKDTKDVVTLNVRGTIMETRRSTLQLSKDSALASRFSTKNEPKQSIHNAVSEWNHDDVVAWLSQVRGISESVIKDFGDNQVTGRELLSLGAEGLKDFGVTRKGTIYLLLKQIKTLEETGSNDPATLIEHNPYCFGKILDHLRHESTFLNGLVETKPDLPLVRDNEKRRYWDIVNHLFPGESSRIFQDGSGNDV